MLDRIGKISPDEEVTKLELKNYEVISRWYVTVVREMTRLDDFFEDPKWIQKKLRFDVSTEDLSYGICLFPGWNRD